MFGKIHHNIARHFNTTKICLFSVNIRSMLSAAHVLAMDAKNLLDVVDSIRLRYPELFLCASQNPSPSTQQIGRVMSQHDGNIAAHHFGAAAIGQTNEESYEIIQRQTYQNLSEIADQTSSIASPDTGSGGEDIYANQQQFDQQGIYDNDCIISAQLNKLNVANDTCNYASAVDSIGTSPKLSPLPPPKPPVAAKPVNLQQKLKPNLNSVATSSSTTTAPSSHANDGNVGATTAANSTEESLKIVEHEQDLYCNANVTE